MKPILDFRCPNHPTVGTIMACVTCRRIFEEHAARTARLIERARSDA